MTVYSDLLSRAVTFDVNGDIDPADRRVHRYVAEQCNCPYPNATLAAVDEVQELTTGSHNGGAATGTLTITLVTGEVVTATSVAFDEAASVLQTSIDASGVANVAGYVAGDIAITGGPIGSGGATTVITFGGSSVRGDHPTCVFDDTGHTGGAGPVESEDTAGIVPRFWFAALKAMGVITGSDPDFGDAPAGQYTVVTHDQLENYPSSEVLKRLILEASVQEGQDWVSELFPALNLK